MVATHYLSVFSGLAALVVAADDPFYMCTDTKCEECPSSVISSGTGYPDCVIYNSEDVFAHQGFNGSVGGGYQVYFDVQEHDSGCATVVRSPASTDHAACGAPVAKFKQPACALLNLETSFMVQSCCGDDCEDAAGIKIRGLGPMGSAGRRSISADGRGGLLLKDSSGTIIEPAVVGSPSPPAKAGNAKRQAAKPSGQRLQKRSCTKDSWKGGDVYTRPATNVQIVIPSVGPGQVTVMKERSQSWSTSMSIGIADILSLGVSTEFTESVSSGTQVTQTIGEGQTGKLGFTATLSCSEGKGQCDDGEVEGEVCWPTMTGDDVSGTYRVIIES